MALPSRSGRDRVPARVQAARVVAGGLTLSAIRVREIWGYLRKQPASFWFINLYLFFEYVRPQQIYRSLDVLPFAWTCIGLTLIAFFLEGFKRRPLYPADRMLMVFCVIVVASSLMALYPQTVSDKIWVFFSWILIYALITNVINTEDRFLIFMLAFLLYSTKMSQHGARSFSERGGSFSTWGATGTPGWFQNSGEFGIQMVIFFPLSLYFILALRKYWPKWKLAVLLFMPLSAAVSIVATSSRGSLLALGPVVLWMTMKSRQRLKSTLMLVVFAMGVWLLVPSEQKQRMSEMGEDETSQTRLIYWERGIEMMNEYPMFGVGFNGWLPYTAYNYPPLLGKGGNRILQHPHNIFIEAGSELGYSGLLAFIGLIGITLYTNYQTRRRARTLPDGGVFATLMAHGLDAALIGYIVAGFFVTVLYYPFFWINLAMTVALHNTVVKRASGVVSSPARGGPARSSRGRYRTA